MFVHDTRKGSPDLTAKSPENAESSCANKLKMEQTSPKTAGNNVSTHCQTLDNLKHSIICYN